MEHSAPGADDEDDLVPNVGTKRSLEQMTQGLSVKVQKQRLWLKRNARICKQASWRPAKRYRGSARKWLSATDNQWKTTLGLTGWKYFCLDEKDSLWEATNWRKWPHTGLATDCGADAMSALCGLEYKWKANITRFLDEAHQKHRAMEDALEKPASRPHG